MSWERWKPEIAKAADPAFHRIEDIEARIRDGKFQLWLEPNACVVSEVVPYPGGSVFQGVWAAGDLNEILTVVHPRMEAWARSVGCTSMLVESREGWSRALKSLGYAPWSVTVRKVL